MRQSLYHPQALATCISKSDCDSCIHTEVETVDGGESDYNQNNVFSTKRGKNLGVSLNVKDHSFNNINLVDAPSFIRSEEMVKRDR